MESDGRGVVAKMKNSGWVLGVVCLVIVLTGKLLAGPFEDGLKAHKRGEYKAALMLIRKAAEQGDVKAQNTLSVMYGRGQGAPRDHVEAFKWRLKAAEQGDADGQYNLGLMYYNGWGVSQNYVEAYKWFSLATSRYSPGAERDRALEARDVIVAKLMTPAQIAEAQRLAREWKRKGSGR